MSIRVLICDELPIVRNGLRTLLDATPDLEVVGMTDNGMEAMVLTRTVAPDVVVTDLELRTIPGVELIRRLGKEDPRPRTVVFTSCDDDRTVADVLHAGAECLLAKDANPTELVAAIRAAAAGRTVLAPTVAQRLVHWFRAQPGSTEPEETPHVAELTPREREVTRLVAHGMSTGEVARELIIGEATVRTHLYRVRLKLGVRDRAQLVSLAYRSGLIQPAGLPATSDRDDLCADAV